jgi:hypothetical protein
MRKLLLLTLSLTALISSPLQAADQNPPKLKAKAAAPAPAPSPFAIGISAGMALSPTENFLTINGMATGSGPLKGMPLGPLVGIVATYDLIPVGPAYVMATAEAHYDFSRGCVGLDCSAERKNGVLLQQGLEFGLSLAQGNSYLPTSGQPANWPLPINVPTSLATNTKLGLRGGLAERWVSLCGVTDTNGDYQCGDQFLWAPYAGVGLSFLASTNWEVKAVYDHIFWAQGNTFATTAATTLLAGISAASVVAIIKQEDDVKLQFLYHF